MNPKAGIHGPPPTLSTRYHRNVGVNRQPSEKRVSWGQTLVISDDHNRYSDEEISPTSPAPFHRHSHDDAESTVAYPKNVYAAAQSVDMPPQSVVAVRSDVSIHQEDLRDGRDSLHASFGKSQGRGVYQYQGQAGRSQSMSDTSLSFNMSPEGQEPKKSRRPSLFGGARASKDKESGHHHRPFHHLVEHVKAHHHKVKNSSM